MYNLPDGTTQSDLDRHRDSDERPCPACGLVDCAPDCDRLANDEAEAALRQV